MGELIELLVKRIAWLTLTAVRLYVLAARFLIFGAAHIAKLTIALVQQSASKTRSPDGRYWWDGKKWVPMLPARNWAITITTLVGVVLIAGVCTAAALSSSAPSALTSGVSTTPSEASTDPEADLSATPPATTSSLPTASGSAQCGDPHAHVYSPDRLQQLAPCVTVAGTVAEIRSEKDGDLHVLLQLDPGQTKYLNSKNTEYEHGWLVLEPVCVSTPTQADAEAACAGYKNPLVIPAVGVHTAVTGAWVLDLDHGWMEIHPVFAFNAAKAPTPSPSTSPTAQAPSPTPSQQAVNLCGAPPNPWNYNFCGGSLITSPPPNFCTYFKCISSFANGTGYVVQCADDTFSKSGGHTGVCSQHGGFKRNLYG